MKKFYSITPLTFRISFLVLLVGLFTNSSYGQINFSQSELDFDGAWGTKGEMGVLRKGYRQYQSCLLFESCGPIQICRYHNCARIGLEAPVRKFTLIVTVIVLLANAGWAANAQAQQTNTIVTSQDAARAKQERAELPDDAPDEAPDQSH